MPKKANRPGARTKSRPVRRPQTSPLDIEQSAGVQAPNAVARVESGNLTAGTGTAASIRRGAPGRRVPTVTTDYTYLKRDIMLLGILAPIMIIVVVVAFFILH